LLASVLASACAVAATATCAPSASADAADSLWWVSWHAGESPTENNVLATTSDGRTVLYGSWSERYDDATDEWTRVTDWHVADTLTRSTSPAPENAQAMSDDGRIILSGGWDEPVVLTDMTTGWTRTLEEDAAIWRADLSGDGSTVLITYDAACSHIDSSCPDDAYRLAVEPVAGGARRDVGMTGTWPAQIADDGGSVLYADSTGVHVWDGTTTSTMVTGPETTFSSASDDLSTVAVGTPEVDTMHVGVWHDGALTSLPDDTDVVVSGDGTAIAWLAADGIHRTDVPSGDDELVAPLPPGTSLLLFDLDADGEEIVYEPRYPDHVDGSLDLWVRHADGTNEKICCDGLDATRVADDVEISDDGAVLAFPLMVLLGDDPECCNREMYVWRSAAAPVLPELRIDDVTIDEGRAANALVHLDRPLEHDVVVDLAVEPGTMDDDDWRLDADRIVIPAGETAVAAHLTAWADTADEPDETATVRIIGVSGDDLADGARLVDDRAAVTVGNAEPAEVHIDDLSRTERGTDQWWSFQVTSDKLVRGVRIEAATVDGTDPLTGARAGRAYTAKRYTVALPAGSRSTKVDVRVLGDAIPELDETFGVHLTSVTNAVIGDGDAVGTIVDDDTPVRLSRVV
jgi:hypothetical protein